MPVTRRLSIVATALALLAPVACSSGSVADDDAVDGDPVAARVVPAATDAPVGSPGVDAESMVVAAMLLTTGGDLEAALAEGVVTQRDVDAAVEALATGALDDLFD